jgi:hypothetical protein
MAVNPNTTFTTGAIFTADQANRFPRGVMAYVVRTAGNVTATTTVADITSMTVTFTAEANRLYKASWVVQAQKNTDGWTQISCTTSANALLGSTIGYGVNGNYVNLTGFTLIDSFSAGSNTVKLRAEAQVGTTTILATAISCQLIIEDMGPR